MQNRICVGTLRQHIDTRVAGVLARPHRGCYRYNAIVGVPLLEPVRHKRLSTQMGFCYNGRWLKNGLN